MSYILKTNLANKSNYGSKRNTSNIKWIVIHFTANDGDTDENNGKYFHNNVVKASAHYFVDSDSITQSVPDNYVAYSVGGTKYNNGGGKYHGQCTNSNSLSIELCDDVKNGKIYPSDKTIENAIAFTKKKMDEYNISASHVIRHFDVTGKKCPAYWCGTDAKDKLWKTEFHNKLTESKPTPTPTPSQPATSSKTVNYKVKVTADSGLNCRKEPNASAAKVTVYAKGATLTVTKESGDWLYVNSKGWVNGKYTQKVTTTTSNTTKTPTYKVGCTYTLQSELKVRTGAGTNYRAKKYSELTTDGKKHDKDKDGALDKGTKVTCKKVIKNGNEVWLETPSGFLCAYYKGKVYIK